MADMENDISSLIEMVKAKAIDILVHNPKIKQYDTKKDQYDWVWINITYEDNSFIQINLNPFGWI